MKSSIWNLECYFSKKGQIKVKARINNRLKCSRVLRSTEDTLFESQHSHQCAIPVLQNLKQIQEINLKCWKIFVNESRLDLPNRRKIKANLLNFNATLLKTVTNNNLIALYAFTIEEFCHFYFLFRNEFEETG